MRLYLVTVAVFLGFSGSVVRADEPAVRVEGPQTVSPGRLVRLVASGDANRLLWHTPGIAEDELAQSDEGRQLFFATAQPGRYTFLLIAVKCTADSKPEVRLVEHIVTVTGSTPAPPPAPRERFGLTSWMRQQTGLVRTDRDLAPALAQAFRAGAAEVTAGSITTLDDLRRKTKDRTATAAGDRAAAWKPLFETLNTELSRLADARTGGTLITLADHAAAWNELADGFANISP